MIQTFQRKDWVLQRPTHATRYVFNLTGLAPAATVAPQYNHGLYNKTDSERSRERAVSMLSLTHPTTFPPPMAVTYALGILQTSCTSSRSRASRCSCDRMGVLCGGTQHRPCRQPVPMLSSFPRAGALACGTTCHTRGATQRASTSVAPSQ